MDVEAKIEALFNRYDFLGKVYPADVIKTASMDDKSCFEDPELNDLQVKLKEHFAEIVGSLIYISITCRPDISCAIGLASKGMHGPSKIHLLYLEGLMRYLKKHKGLKLVYSRTNAFLEFADGLSQAYPEIGNLGESPVIGLSDANFAGGRP